MPNPFLLIVSGLPCAGKTSIAERLANELKLPLMTKDGIKELLFNALGWKDRNWSRQLSQASIELLLYFAESQLAAGNSLVIESNFQPDLAVPRFRAMQARYAAVLFQVHCRAAADTLYERFKNRTGTRHPGHVDQEYLAEFQSILTRAPQETPDLGCPLVVVDTTDFQKVDYPALLKAVRDVQGAAQAQR
jgi:predicted kinase